MKKLPTRIVLAAGAFALALGASANSLAQSGGHGQHGAAATQSTQQQGGHEMMQVMQNMHQKMSGMQMSGDPDHDFAMMMRAHHQAGIDMAQAELKNGKDAQMKQTAKKVISDQTKEIKKLDEWMAKHKSSGT